MDKIDALAAVPDVDRALLHKAVSTAQEAFSRWGAVPLGRRKAIMASLLNKIADHADELSALLSVEQGGSLARARWEIDLLTKAFGPALMEIALYENEKDAYDLEQITRRYVPIDSNGVITLWNLPVILSFGKVLPALLRGDSVVLRPSPRLRLTVLRISDYVRELLPSGVFNVITGGHDLWPWRTSHSGIDLITFTRSANKASGYRNLLLVRLDRRRRSREEMNEERLPTPIRKRLLSSVASRRCLLTSSRDGMD
jgi:acyl-CoA reductase-like NAD-dependent aldehyde dehydrogenase